MTGKNSKDAPAAFHSLRQHVETLLDNHSSSNRALTARDLKALVHELNVHQSELEIQNDALQQAQSELANVRDQYVELFDFAPFGYVTLTRNGSILAANLMAATMLACDRELLQGRGLSEILAPESVDVFHRHLDDVFAGNGKVVCEVEARREGLLPIGIRFESITCGPQTKRCCRSAMIDITSLKTAEKIIRDNEDRLRQLNLTLEQRVANQTQQIRLLAEAVAHLGEGVLITQAELEWPGPKIIFVNEAMCRITGYETDELIGQSPRILQGIDTEGATLRRFKSELLAGHSCSAELINYRKDGTPYHAELFVTPLSNSQGRHTHFVSIHRDISERKQAEKALRHSHDELEQRVKERTINLEQANRACRQAMTEKTRFLTAVSHDLRQPLQAIELYLSLLAPQLELPEQREIYEKIRKPLGSIAEILNLLLDISKLESGTVKPSLKSFPVQAVLNRVIANNQLQATKKGLLIECGKTDSVVYSDPVLLERAVENILSNAIRYTSEGKIKISCRRISDSIAITIADTGIGIEQKELDVIFESYYQIDNPIRDRNKGFGLGLSIVKLITELLDHPVKVHSAPGEGSTFSIQVPLAPALRQARPP